MKYLLDTCIVSELAKKRPSESVLRWIESVEEDDLFVSSVTIGELRKGSRSGRAVILEDIGEYDCVCETVRSAVHSAEIMGYRMNIADISSREGDSRKIRGFKHIFSCLNIIAVFIDLQNIVKNHSCRFFCCGNCAFGVAVAYVSLNSMSESVHARC